MTIIPREHVEKFNEIVEECKKQGIAASPMDADKNAQHGLDAACVEKAKKEIWGR